MKRLLLITLLVIVAPKISFSQEVKKPGYNKYLFNPHTDAERSLKNALTKVQSSHRHVLVVIGGDWSYWSRVFWGHITRNYYTNKNYELVLVNFSPVNKNEAIREKLHVPKDRGYPILVVLDEQGNNLITTDTDDMKLNIRAYDENLIDMFTEKWLTYKTYSK